MPAVPAVSVTSDTKRYGEPVRIAPTMRTMSTKTEIDWELGEKLYCAGQLSLRVVASRIGCSDGALRKRAKKEGWSRDLSKKVQEAVRKELVRNPGTQAPTRELDPRTEAEIIKEAAMTTIEVVRSHRTTLGRAKAIGDRLFEQLDDASRHRAEIIEAIDDEMDPQIEAATGALKVSLVSRKTRMLRAVELPGHAATYRDLANAVEKFIRTERDAWGLDTKEPPNPDEGLTDAELDRAIAAAAADAGVELGG